MQCPFPISIVRPNGHGNSDRITVPCGKCAYCLMRKRQEWLVRLTYEARDHPASYFITLTYTDENIKYGSDTNGVLVKEDLQKFFKRIRKSIKIRYYAIGEYGTRTHRPHYHAIIFTDVNSQDFSYHLQKSWTLGNVHVGKVSESSMNYCTKHQLYSKNKLEYDVPPFTLISLKPAIGHSYLKKMSNYHDTSDLRNTTVIQGKHFILPRYYRDKLYTKETRQRYANSLQSTAINEQELADFNAKYPYDNYFVKKIQDYYAYRDSLYRKNNKHTNSTI